MVHERYYTFVGVFVVVALSLFVLGFGYLYHQYEETKNQTYVMFFNGSLTGISASSAVAYRGVKIGEVKLIEITENEAKTNVEIPVYVNFYVETRLGITIRPIELLIKKGVVANISQPSLLSGAAQIDLIETNSPATGQQKYYRKIPIFPTNAVENPTTFNDTLKTIRTTVKEFGDFIHSKEVRDTIDSVKSMTDSLEILANTINQNSTPFFSNFAQTLAQVSKTANSLQNLSDYLSRHPESLIRGRP
ncbi:MlaD family protein [Legionella fallonii]|uniref:Mce/MlaD domain-containing protein n=1 Tax=Legionella fallonii LLAP-10 TaxID=1212491 RepID=A0A098G1D3_9GAMM|nr:MlaD family protein [Legionella fallonii]CEG56277.1 conserved protein of unknown function [Legionella fallonii LLAP-10]